MKATSSFAAIVAAVVSTSHRLRLLEVALLDPDLRYEPAEVFSKEVLVRVSKLQCAALCLRAKSEKCPV